MISVPNSISPEEYLAIEHDNPIRHEYRRGLVSVDRKDYPVAGREIAWIRGNRRSIA